MRHYRLLFVVILGPAVAAQQMPETVFVGKQEILPLDHWADPAKWRPAECEVTQSAKRHADNRPTMRMHVPVDHHGGEAAYPIGWPRMDLPMTQLWERDWRAFDRFEFRVFTESSRDELPGTPLQVIVYCPDKTRQWSRSLGELKLGRWVEFSLPISEMKYVGNVRTVKFSVAESNYKDKDVVEFHIGGFRFVRSAECEVTELAVANRALFQGQPIIKLQLTVVGPPEKVSRGVPFTLRRGDEKIRVETLPLQRGKQTLEMDLSELSLAPGDYTLTAFEDDKEKRRTARFRVVETPWKND